MTGFQWFFQRWGHKRSHESFVCQTCGALTDVERETHRALYVRSDWHGFNPELRRTLDPQAVYLVNPAHPDDPPWRIRGYDPERAKELAAISPPWWQDPFVVMAGAMLSIGILLSIVYRVGIR